MSSNTVPLEQITSSIANNKDKNIDDGVPGPSRDNGKGKHLY